jgi:hypothetical protein
MMPFADEQGIKGGICVGGDSWHRGLLLDIVENGLLFNAYNTPVETLHGLDEVDCFIGGLVATGIPPQMTAGTTPAAKPLIPRIKYWLDLYKVYGMATESSIDILHYPDVFLIGLSGGTEAGDHRGLFVGNTTSVVFPDDVADNTTVLAFLGYQIPYATISFGTPAMKTFTLFAASDNSTVHMSGGFCKFTRSRLLLVMTLCGSIVDTLTLLVVVAGSLASQSLTDTILPAGGGAPKVTVLFPAGTSGKQTHSVSLKVGDYAKYEKK